MVSLVNPAVASVNFELIPSNTIVMRYPKTAEARNDVAQHFKPGDIVFTTQKLFFFSLTAYLQFFFKLLRIKWPFREAQYSHAAIVVSVVAERVLVADIVMTKGSEPRIYDILTNIYSRLGFNSTYTVIRSNELSMHQQENGQKSLVERIAAVADRMGLMNRYLKKKICPARKERSKKITNPGFAYKEAFKAILYGWQPNKNQTSRIRIFKQIYDEHTKNQVATGGVKPRKFFCSYFVAHVLQQVEAYRAFTNLAEEKPELLQELLGLVHQVKAASDSSEKSRLITAWAIANAARYGEEVVQRMQRFKFDPKTMAPGALKVYLEDVENFKEILRIHN